MRKFNAMKTIEIGKDYALMSFSTKIFSLKEIKRTALEISKKAIVMLDGDQDEVIVEIQSKGSLDKLVKEFCQKLLKNVSSTKK